VEDDRLLEWALVENIQREDLNAIEIAISYQRLIEECALTQESLSERVGKKRATIANYLRLLKLPAEIQLGIREKKISMGHARTLVNIENPKAQVQVYFRILDEGLSVRKTEEVVRELNEQPKKAAKLKQKIEKEDIPEEYVQLQSHLAKHFNTKVQFQRNTGGKGKIIIPFQSDEDLERIVGILDNFKG
jgi:ParB family chromosome partitioning protein